MIPDFAFRHQTMDDCDANVMVVNQSVAQMRNDGAHFIRIIADYEFDDDCDTAGLMPSIVLVEGWRIKPGEACVQ